MPYRAQRPCPQCGRTHQPGTRCLLHPQGQAPAPDPRPTSARRGYGARWRVKRKDFLERHPYCEDCGQPATHADHVPSRRILVMRGVDNPDADVYLHPRCGPCHSSKTAREDGGYGNPAGRGDKKVYSLSK